MNDKTQPSTRKDGFGTEGIGEDGDAGMGQSKSGGGGTGAKGKPDTHQAEGASGDEHGSHDRRSPANKQGLDGGQQD
jgi:hypothetical protein